MTNKLTDLPHVSVDDTSSAHAAYLVTIKVPSNPAHDPGNKVTDICPVTEMVCTDTTGAHHTFLVMSTLSITQLRDRLSDSYKTTRIEYVDLDNVPVV